MPSNHYFLLKFFPIIYKTFGRNIVLRKLLMVIQVEFTTLKFTFPHKKQYSGFDNFRFFLCEDSYEIQKFTDLAKLLTLIKTEFVKFLSKFCIYPSDIHSMKTNSGVSRSSYLVNKKNAWTYTFVIFCKLKVLS